MILDSLWRLKWRRDRYERRTSRELKVLKEKKKHQEAHDLEQEMEYELMLWQKAIWVRRTSMLLAAAKSLDVPVSYDKELWGTSEEGDRYLTPKAQHELHKAIRQEKDDRLTHRMRWVKEVVIPVVSFILGLMTAYVAMKRNH